MENIKADLVVEAGIATTAVMVVDAALVAADAALAEAVVAVVDSLQVLARCIRQFVQIAERNVKSPSSQPKDAQSIAVIAFQSTRSSKSRNQFFSFSLLFSLET
jgi:hypothetical protein